MLEMFQVLCSAASSAQFSSFCPLFLRLLPSRAPTSNSPLVLIRVLRWQQNKLSNCQNQTKLYITIQKFRRDLQDVINSDSNELFAKIDNCLLSYQNATFLSGTTTSWIAVVRTVRTKQTRTSTSTASLCLFPTVEKTKFIF